MSGVQFCSQDVKDMSGVQFCQQDIRGSNIRYFTVPNAGTAWALTKALLTAKTRSCSCKEEPLPEAVAAVTKRRKLELSKVPAGDVPSAQLADLADRLGVDELQAKLHASQAACLLHQLRRLPAFSEMQM